eukprot:GILJ01007327.1.p1 GENE.GILJ01007327.1~~GILJ01007327.1.p1  ORF type:complete len:351 (+),score=31.24 GILJ01007327.1:41-1054(+)
MANSDVRNMFDSISLSVISFLENHAGIQDVHFEERKGVLPDEIVRWEKQHHPFVLPDDFKAFLQISDGLMLRWKINLLAQQPPIPLGTMHLNQLQQVKQISIEEFVQDVEGVEKDSTRTERNMRPVAFCIDHLCADGRLALLYRSGHTDPQVWFQGLSCMWSFLSASFTDYFRLMIMHLGMPRWQYAFTTVGLDPVSEQWIRFLSPERLAIDMSHRLRKATEEAEVDIPIPRAKRFEKLTAPFHSRSSSVGSEADTKSSNASEKQNRQTFSRHSRPSTAKPKISKRRTISLSEEGKTTPRPSSAPSARAATPPIPGLAGSTPLEKSRLSTVGGVRKT